MVESRTPEQVQKELTTLMHSDLKDEVVSLKKKIELIKEYKELTDSDLFPASMLEDRLETVESQLHIADLLKGLMNACIKPD